MSKHADAHSTDGDTRSGDATRPARALRWALVAAWAGVIFVVSAQPGSNLPGGYSFQAHLIEYAALGALCFGALRLDMTDGRAALLAVVLSSLYGISDEIHQLFVPMRMADPLDWLVDTLGAGLAVIAALWLDRLVTRWRGTKDQ